MFTAIGCAFSYSKSGCDGGLSWGRGKGDLGNLQQHIPPATRFKKAVEVLSLISQSDSDQYHQQDLWEQYRFLDNHVDYHSCGYTLFYPKVCLQDMGKSGAQRKI